MTTQTMNNHDTLSFRQSRYRHKLLRHTIVMGLENKLSDQELISMALNAGFYRDEILLQIQDIDKVVKQRLPSYKRNERAQFFEDLKVALKITDI